MVRPVARQFYADTLRILTEAEVPFVVGGALALKHFCGVARDTKDLDVFLKRTDLDRALAAVEAEGYGTEVTFPHWLAKIQSDPHFVDVIFDSANGLCPVDDSWFERAERCKLWGVPVLLSPAEELVASKAFVMERERFDGADIYHVLEARAEALDWDHLLSLFGPHWRVLLGHLIFFTFVYPRRRGAVPKRIMTMLLDRARAEQASAPDDPACGGTLLSREQYLIDLHDRGYADARLPPLGRIPAEHLEIWTAAIKSDR